MKLDKDNKNADKNKFINERFNHTVDGVTTVNIIQHWDLEKACRDDEMIT